MTPAEFRAARESLGLTQAQLAAILGYAGQVSVSRIEGGESVSGSNALAMRAMLLLGLPDTWSDATRS